MRLRRILSLHLSSSVFFALGAALPVICYAVAYHKGTTATINDGLVEMFSWAFLCFHVLPEIIIDLNTFPKARRKLHHMRYGKGPCTNFGQSMIFATCCFFQGIYFAHTWSIEGYNQNSEEEIEAYELINLIAGHLWLLSGLIAVCGIGTSCISSRSEDSDDGPAFWEKIANDLYLTTTVTMCAAGYVIMHNRPIGHIMHIVVRGFWCLLGAFYLVWDLLEEYAYQKREGVFSEESSSRRRHKQRLVDDEESG